MDKASLAPLWDMTRLRHGIGLRCVEALPADQLDSHPIRGMRTPKELVVHFYSYLKSAAESVQTGRLSWNDKADLAGIKTRDQLVAYAQNCWKAADAAFAKATDAQLAGTVKTDWGERPGFAILSTIPDEYLHHRGQLYVYLRQLGATPPENWDFEHNAAELRPKQHA